MQSRCRLNLNNSIFVLALNCRDNTIHISDVLVLESAAFRRSVITSMHKPVLCRHSLLVGTCQSHNKNTVFFVGKQMKLLKRLKSNANLVYDLIINFKLTRNG